MERWAKASSMQRSTHFDVEATAQRAAVLFWIAGFLALGLTLGLVVIDAFGEAAFVAAASGSVLLLGGLLARRSRRPLR